VCNIVSSQFSLLPKILQSTRTLQQQQQQQEQKQGVCNKKNFCKIKKIDFDVLQLKCTPLRRVKRKIGTLKKVFF